MVLGALKEAREVLFYNNGSRFGSFQKRLGEKREYLHDFSGDVHLLVNSVGFLGLEPLPCFRSSFSQLKCHSSGRSFRPTLSKVTFPLAILWLVSLFVYLRRMIISFLVYLLIYPLPHLPEHNLSSKRNNVCVGLYSISGCFESKNYSTNIF